MRTALRLFCTFMLMGIFFYISCKKDELSLRDYPRVTTAEVTDIDSTGALFSGEIVMPGNEEIIDYGFVWGQYSPTLTGSEYVSLGKLSNKNKFEARIDHALATKLKYYVKAYVKTEKYTVYGKEVPFLSLGALAPKIISFWPDSAMIGDTVYITGKYLSKLQDGNGIIFEKITIAGKTLNDSTILGIIPRDIDTISPRIGLSILGNNNYHSKRFKLIPAKIYSISKSIGYWGDTIKIRGKDFLKPSYSTLKINGLIASVQKWTDTSVLFVIPASLNRPKTLFSIGPFRQPSVEFNIGLPEILKTSLDSFPTPQSITLSLKGSKQEFAKVFFNGSEVTNIKWNKDNEAVINIEEKRNGTYPLQLEVLGQKSNIKNINIINPNFTETGLIITNPKDTLVLNGIALDQVTSVYLKGEIAEKFEIIEKAFDHLKIVVLSNLNYGSIYNLTLYTKDQHYTPSLSIKIADPQIFTIHPNVIKGYGDTIVIKGVNFHPRYYPSININGNYATVLMKSKNTITAVTDNIPASEHDSLKISYTGFKKEFSGNSLNFSIISPWKVKRTLPNSNEGFSKGGFSLNNKGYAMVYSSNLGNNTLHEYNPSTDSWIISNSTFPEKGIFLLFSDGTKGFTTRNSNQDLVSNQIIEYDPIEKKWNKIVDLPQYSISYRWVSTTFNNKIFLISDKTITINNTYYSPFYIFDLSKKELVPKRDFPNNTTYTSAFILNNTLYVYNGSYRRFYKYDSIADEWIPLASHSLAEHDSYISTSIDNKGYTLRDHVFQYDPVFNSWSKKSKCPMWNSPAFHFVINSKLYIEDYSGKFFEYDPSLEP